MEKIFYLLFYIFIRDLIKGAFINCANEMNVKFAHVLVETHGVVCHDDTSELSSYPYNNNITLDGQWHTLLVGATTDIFNCHISCTGCYGPTQNDCFTCSSLARGTKPLFPTHSQFTSGIAYSCPCRDNYQDDNTKDCLCPSGCYTKRSTVDDIISCEKCPMKFSVCKYDNTTSSIIALQCANGVGRSMDLAANCACIPGYSEVENEFSCAVICNQPCATCVSESATACLSCYDPNMNLNDQQCTCKPEGFYLSISDSNYKCIACYPSCLTCLGSSQNQCSSCVDNNMNCENSQCICRQGYYMSQSQTSCYPCHATCLTCNGGDTYNCLSCDPQTQRTLQNGYCQCPQFFVTSLVPMCVRCDPSCLTCYDQESCYSCISGSYRQIISYGDLCTCMPGYAENPSNPFCVECHYSCQSCQDLYTICTACPYGSLRYLINNECLCPDRYYDDGVSQKCQACNYSCLTCYGGQNDNCLSCENTKNRIINNQNQCVCQEGYGYVDLYTELCQVCNSLCQTCDQINKCLSCYIDKHRMLSESGTCICDDGYFQNNQICQKCHSTCKSCFGIDENSCISCDLDAGRKLEINQCQCNEGYFNNDDECKQCYYACKTCVNGLDNGCETCDPSRTLVDSRCICPITKIDDGENNKCLDCHYSCLTCTGQQSNDCLTCYDNSPTINRIKQYQQCICPPRWFDDQVNENCKQCHESCLTCFDIDQYSCISCQETEYRQLFSNSCLCQDGYVDTPDNICVKCEYRCQTCTLDPTNCLTCPVGSSRNLQQQIIKTQYNTCLCAPGAGSDLQDKPICQVCHFSCQQCLGADDNECTSCDINLNRQLKTTYCKCTTGYYEVNVSECPSCSQYCLDCVTYPSNCTACNSNDFRTLNGNQCLCGIRFGSDSLSYYDVGEVQCSACHYTCYTCYGSSFQQCSTCDSTKDLRQYKNSLCECITGYIDYGTPFCEKCDERCLTCAIQKTSFTSCPVGSLRVLNIQAKSCDCPLGYFDPGTTLCQVCDITCQTCSDRANKCLSCNDGQNRTYNQQLFTCECLFGYFDMGNGNCILCHFSCTGCSGPLSTDCVSCPDYQTTFRILKSNQCLCQDQYFDDYQNKICQACSPTCYTCKDSQNNCLICQNDQNRILSGSQCKCIEGYFEGGSVVCDKCSTNCLECQNNINYCTKCGVNRTLNTGTCICQIGYFDDENFVCQKCEFSCLTCQGESTFCTTCDSNNFRKLDSNKCICLSGLLDVGVPFCQSCDVRCLTCQNQVTKCTTCDGSKNRILKEDQCLCQDGYFENSVIQCQPCDNSCLTCQGSPTFCLSCPELTKINSLGQCNCKEGTFNDNGVCSECSYKCLTCQTNSNSCTSCNPDRNLVLNSCICEDGSYDAGISECKKCFYQCTTCNTSANNCLTCDSISQRKLQGSDCVCLWGYYDAGSYICDKCNYTCLTCKTDQQNCTSCDSSLNRVQYGNLCNCQIGYFDDGAICQPCHYSCLTCSQQATKCTSCDISLSFRMDKSTNFSQCPCQKGFYDDGTKICKQCAYNCIDCDQNPNNCTVCNNNPAFSRINLTPSCVCQDGYYDDGIQPICIKCHIRCQTCITNPTNCLTCESPLTRNSIPQCDCKDGYYLNTQQKCSQCSIKCLTCITNQDNCLSCQPDRITKQCLCQDGYYEANLLLCQQCSPKCVTCENDKLSCLTCKADRINPPNCVCKYHYYDDFINIECQECDQYCGSCDNNGCIDCAANRLQSAKTCICPANSVSYTDTPWCSTCTVAVVTGILSDDLSTILYTFEFPLLFNFPHKVDIQAQCQQIISNKSITLLGQSPLCTIDDNTLLIELGDGSTVLVGDQIEFISDLLKHQDCSDQTLNKIIRTIINPPTNLLKPIVKLSYPVNASPCSQIQISITQQNINGERNLQLLWSSSLALSSIIQANQQQYQTLTIESGELPENSNIDIQLYFINFLNQSDSVSINFTTLSYKTPQFNFITTKTQYLFWSPIKLIVFYNNEICASISKGSKNQILIDFTEVVEYRTNNSLPIKFQQSSFKLTDSSSMVSALIPARTLTYNSNYRILVTYQDLLNNQILSQYLEIYIMKSPLIVQIVDGTRIQNYLKQLTILIQAKDPDSQTEWNTDNNINLEVTCSDPQTQLPCVVNNQVLKLNSSYRQDIAPRSFDPFNVIVFKVTAKKGIMQISDSATIIFLDAELPPLNIQYPQGYKMRDVNINEKLQFYAVQSSKDIQFRYALVYDYEIVYITNVPNQLIKFAIWDNFVKFKFINTISVRILAHDIKYLMPQYCSIQLTVNMPPVNSIVNINPQFGNAFFTNFTFRVTNSRDSDTPISYRFAYYQNQTLFDYDTNKGSQDNLIILQDFSSIQSYKGLLESGDLIILVSVADSLGSTVNYTQKLKSQDFFESQSLNVDNSSICVNFVQQLSNTTYNSQQLLILAQELIKLYQSNITADCKQKINQMLLQYQEQLFAFIGQSNTIIASRIQNILSDIYSLKLASTRLLNEQQQDICFNTSSRFVYINFLNIIQNQNDSQALIDKVDQIGQQVDKSIQQNIQYISDYQSTLDFGDDSTYRNIQQNILQRKGQIKLLSGLYSQAFQQKQIIRNQINILLDSLQLNIEIDQQGIQIRQSNVGVYINKLSQIKYNSFIIPDITDPDYQDLNNFTINRFVQIAKYPSNYNIQNVSQILQEKKTSKYEYSQTIIQFEMSMYDPFIYVEIGNTTNKVDKIFQGRLNYNIDYQFKPCNNSSISIQPHSNYSLVCSNFRNNQWKINECETSSHTNKHGNIVFSCLCNYINPITLMMINTTNITINQQKAELNNQLQELIDLSMKNYNISIIIISIFIILLIVTRFNRNKSIILSEIRESYNQWKLNHEIGLTQKPQMSTELLKDNIKYLHQVTRIFYVNYTHISALEQILILTFNANVLITVLHLFNGVLNHSYLPIPITLLVTLIFQIVGKILEGFFTGPYVLKVIGYIIIIALNLGTLFVNIIINMQNINQIIYIVLIGLTILIYGPIEILIQYMKLKLAFQICSLLDEEPLNPVLNLVYYFIQDEVILLLVKGGQIDGQYN